MNASSPSSTVVLKFGGSVLGSADDLPRAVRRIYRDVRAGRRVVAVVSAFGETTDRLLAVADRRVSTMAESEDRDHAVAALLATGEEETAARLLLALGDAGVPATLLDATRIGFRTSGPVLDGDPVAVDTTEIRAALADVPVAVVPGFIGRAADGRTTLLGRGGSDLTAIFLGHTLGAPVCLLKDVDGLYERDPATPGPTPERFASVTFERAHTFDAAIVQPKAIRYAHRHGVPFDLGAIDGPAPTTIGAAQTRTDDGAALGAHSPLRVAVLGCGTVGTAVVRHLTREAARFVITGIAVRDLDRTRDESIPRALLSTDAIEVATGADVVIEAMGGTDVAREAVRAALAAGRHVITANKSLIATEGEALAALARAHGATLRYGASVGGAVPMVEAVARVAPEGVRSIAAVPNGTTTFLFDRIGRGTPVADALAAARANGLMEADADDDVNGADAARKLTILCRLAFGATIAEVAPPALDFASFVEDHCAERPSDATRIPRLVARAERREGSIETSVGFEWLTPDDPLARTRAAENCLVVRTDRATHRVHGTGAGGAPTAAAILGDLDELARTGDAPLAASVAVNGGAA